MYTVHARPFACSSYFRGTPCKPREPDHLGPDATHPGGCMPKLNWYASFRNSWHTPSQRCEPRGVGAVPPKRRSFHRHTGATPLGPPQSRAQLLGARYRRADLVWHIPFQGGRAYALQGVLGAPASRSFVSCASESKGPKLERPHSVYGTGQD